MSISSITKKIKQIVKKYMNNVSFGSKGRKVKIIKPIRIIGRKYFHFGCKITILNGSRIEALDHYSDEHKQEFLPSLIIDDNVSIGQNFHCTCVNKVHIHSKVTIGPNVLINDSEHIKEIDKGVRRNWLNGWKCRDR